MKIGRDEDASISQMTFETVSLRQCWPTLKTLRGHFFLCPQATHPFLSEIYSYPLPEKGALVWAKELMTRMSYGGDRSLETISNPETSPS